MTQPTTAESLELKLDLHGTRSQFSGSFVRIKEGWNAYLSRPELKVVLDDIRGSNSELLRDQQSFFFGKQFRSLGLLQPDDRVRFHARIVLSKGGIFKLSRPTRVQRADDTVQTQLE